MPTLTLLGGPRQGENDDSPTSPTGEECGDKVLNLVKKLDILRDEVNRRRQEILQVMNSFRESHWLEVAQRHASAESQGDDRVANDTKDKEAKPELEARNVDGQRERVAAKL